MATERTRLIELTLVRYREEFDQEYIYFWIEKYNGEHVSPVFESEDDALFWYKEISEKMKNESQNWKIQKLGGSISDC